MNWKLLVLDPHGDSHGVKFGLDVLPEVEPSDSNRSESEAECPIAEPPVRPVCRQSSRSNKGCLHIYPCPDINAGTFERRLDCL